MEKSFLPELKKYMQSGLFCMQLGANFSRRLSSRYQLWKAIGKCADRIKKGPKSAPHQQKNNTLHSL